MHTLDSRCFSALSQTFSCSLFLFELVLLVGKYGIWTSEALAIVERHHLNSLHASCVHNTTLIVLVTRVTPVAPQSPSSLSSIFSFVLHSACYYVSSSTAERHVLLVLALPTSARDTGPREQRWEGRPLLTQQHLHGTGKLSFCSFLAVFPTLVPGFPEWAVDAHSLS